MSARGPLIAVIGNGHEGEAHDAVAFEVGALLAKAGCVLVNGGLGGVMAASAKGARSEGGLTVGILPGQDASAANSCIDIPIPTGMGEMRNLLIIRCAAGAIAIGGGYGTLSEIALALKTSKPVVGIGTWDLAADVTPAADAHEAVRLMLKALKAS